MAPFRWQDVPDDVLEQATDEYLRRQQAREMAERKRVPEKDEEFLQKLGIKP